MDLSFGFQSPTHMDDESSTSIQQQQQEVCRCIQFLFVPMKVLLVVLIIWFCCCCWQQQQSMVMAAFFVATPSWTSSSAFSSSVMPTCTCHHRGQHLFSNWNGKSPDANQWSSSFDDDEDNNNNNNNPMQQQPQSEDETDDWQDHLSKQRDGSFWSSFESPTDSTTTKPSSSSTFYNGDVSNNNNNNNNNNIEQEETEAWLDTLASLTAEEIQFNIKEADRADKVRQMEEWGFDRSTIAATLGVATDTTLEEIDEVDRSMKTYRQSAYRRHEYDDVDLTNVESHAMVEKDPDTDEPVRSQMVYVDEHTCIGCTNCAMTAQSTFFMHHEHGRARVFQQWGDDDETIQIAIETCPVDCIHYVPYDELVHLEMERRNQNINFKARLVSQAESGGMTALSHRVGGPNAFTPPQRISGNMKPRCGNCPTRGCSNCPMYGIGQNPEFQRKELERKEKATRRRLQEQRERESKRVDL